MKGGDDGDLVVTSRLTSLLKRRSCVNDGRDVTDERNGGSNLPFLLVNVSHKSLS